MVKKLQELSKNKNLQTAITIALESSNVGDAASWFLLKVDEALFEVENCLFTRAEKQQRYRHELLKFRGTVMEVFLKRDPNSTGPIFNEGMIERLGAIADAVSERIEFDPDEIDRLEFAEKTAELIEEAKSWDMETYASRSLIMGLGLIAEITSTANTSVSDSEIRRRVSRIVAAFAVEFANMDKEFETRWETIKRWAKLGYKGSSVPLALTSDAAAVAGLLPKP